VVVTIDAADYGRFGAVTETLPAGFTYISSSLEDSQVSVSGQVARFTLQGDSSFTYTVNASNTPGDYTFSGVLRDEDRVDHTMADSDITVEGAGAPSATRSFPSEYVDPGSSVVVTIEATNYGRFGAVTETLPTGFTYTSSSLDDSQINVSGQVARFTRC